MCVPDWKMRGDKWDSPTCDGSHAAFHCRRYHTRGYNHTRWRSDVHKRRPIRQRDINHHISSWRRSDVYMRRPLRQRDFVHLIDSCRSSDRDRVFEESAIDDPDPSDSIIEDRSVTYEIVKGGTAKGKDMLVESIGFAYTQKIARANSVTWWCSKRSKSHRCPAKVSHIVWKC